MRPETEPVSVRQAIGLDGWIEYRHDYRAGATAWQHHEFSRPCVTIRNVQPDWRMVVGGERRMFTAAELAALCGFHPAFRFSGKQAETWQRLGNAVPPLFCMAMATEVRRFLDASRSDLPSRCV
jgi:site-specific DNA-cytosine methylase